MKKNPGRKERRNIARANRKAEGRTKMKLHNWNVKRKIQLKGKDLSDSNLAVEADKS